MARRQMETRSTQNERKPGGLVDHRGLRDQGLGFRV